MCCSILFLLALSGKEVWLEFPFHSLRYELHVHQLHRDRFYVTCVCLHTNKIKEATHKQQSFTYPLTIKISKISVTSSLSYFDLLFTRQMNEKTIKGWLDHRAKYLKRQTWRRRDSIAIKDSLANRTLHRNTRLASPYNATNIGDLIAAVVAVERSRSFGRLGLLVFVLGWSTLDTVDLFVPSLVDLVPMRQELLLTLLALVEVIRVLLALHVRPAVRVEKLKLLITTTDLIQSTTLFYFTCFSKAQIIQLLSTLNKFPVTP